jgi:hypothetical protein
VTSSKLDLERETAEPKSRLPRGSVPAHGFRFQENLTAAQILADRRHTGGLGGHCHLALAYKQLPTTNVTARGVNWIDVS